MRKSPTFKTESICKKCNVSFTPTGPRQFYCGDCKVIASKERKRKHYLKNNPNAYQEKEEKVCTVCDAPFASSFDGLPYCNKHYLRLKTNGTTDYVGRKSKNTYTINGDVTILKTTKGIEFKIDTADLDKVLKYTWCISKTGYLVANINHKVTKLHRYILDLTNPSDIVDHINHDPLDNQISNLRVCYSADNSKNLKTKSNNVSGFPGVGLIKKTGKYRARIMVDRKEIHLGNFDTLDDAISARKAAELKYFGEFSPNN